MKVLPLLFPHSKKQEWGEQMTPPMLSCAAQTGRWVVQESIKPLVETSGSQFETCAAGSPL
jgi:hypothetical protein